MYFKKIDLQGFKSFAEPVTIEFHEGITCIVGPNGSGKSNISDAIRWVLGEQSPKMLRGGKMEEVIFSGTANRKSRGMAEVTLTIDNTSNILPIDYSEVAITRRMYRSGESEYFINKVPCRLRDIRELIMDTGIGVEGYSIIGQGKIADIVSNKPESRREIFEEAAGIVKYRAKKSESERKLESAKNNLERVNDIIGEIESRIDGLREDSIKASEYLELRERNKNIEINIILKNIESIELKNEYIKDDIAELSNQIEAYKEEKQAIDKDVAENRARNEELESICNQTRDKLLASVEEINSLSNRNLLRQEKLSAIVKDLQRLDQELTALAQKREKEERNAEELRKNKEKIGSELEDQKENLEKKNAELSRLTGEAEEAAKAIDTNKEKIFELHSRIVEKNSEINSLRSLLDALGKRKLQINAEKQTSDAEGGLLSTDYEKAVQNRNSVLGELKAAEEKSIAAKSKYSNDLNREKLLNQELGELKVAAGQASARLRMIEEMENAYEGYNQAVKFVMKSDLSGLHGVVAELIQVPPGFETAIETALGNAVQNIVCSDDHAAQEAIASLKANKAGRLTFLPLSSIKPSASGFGGNLANEDGFKGYGVDCIKFDAKYKKIMEYLLGRVVVVDKLSNAVRLSKSAGGGLRFVTLEGEIINSGGAITGGAYRNNTAGLLERKAEAKKLQSRLSEIQKKHERINAELEDIAAALAAGRIAIDESDKKYRDTELILLTCDNDINRLASRISDSEDARSKWDRELSSIDNEEASASAMIDALTAEIRESENRIAESELLAEKALEAYEDLKTKLEAANEEITQARLSVGVAESEKNNVDSILSRIESYIEDYSDEEKGRTEAINTLEAEKLSLMQGDESLAARLEEKEADRAETEELLRRSQEEKILVTRYLNEVEQKKNSMEGILLDYQTSKHELELKLTKNETLVESYKEKLWEDFEVSYVQAIEFRKKEFVMTAAVKESREIKNRMKELGEVNIGAIREYETVKERYEFLTAQRSDLLSAMDSLIQIIEDMDRTIKKSFKESFDQIVINFEKSFQALFGGGTAELRLEDETKPLETGIEIVAQPPGKKLQNINLMSGGEKTMTAIALMFAILKAKPTPFCILDEVEAALDDINIDRFAQYLSDFNETQFALVTHQKSTMEYADVLYGVTMPEQGISKVISLKLGDVFEF